MAKEKKSKRKDKDKKGKKSKALTKKKKKSKKLSASQQRQNEIKIRELIGEGLNPTEIMEEMNLQPHILLTYLNRIRAIDEEQFKGLTSVEVYSTFIEKSKKMIRELQKMRKRFDYRKQFTALVASVKQEHEINKDVVKLGQQLGFIENKGGEISVESEMVFSTMTTEQVQEEIQNEIERLNNMATGSTVIMRPELIETVGDNEKVKKYIPDYVEVKEEEKTKKKKAKIKTKIKLKRRS